VTVDGSFQGEVWWQEVAESALGGLEATGHRIADITALAGSMDEAIRNAYSDIRKIRSLGSYYRTDVGQSLWPPGNA
jgi:phosphoribosylamine-glycine ligase